MQSELVALLQGVKIPQPTSSRDNVMYRPNHANANGNAQDQSGRSSFYQGIYCHNCRDEGHYSTSCSRPVVSGAQRKANKRAIDELQGGFRQYSRGPGPTLSFSPAQVAPAAVASNGEERQE